MGWEIVLATICVSSLYVNWNLFRKTEQLEDANEELANWLDGYTVSLRKILDDIKELDSKNMFETDDEVGSLYKQISDTVKSLEDLTNEK
tara:strand:+ start:231 stop:500 length:270 start_codon:yes stop_codon:yes gene_type:complete